MHMHGYKFLRTDLQEELIRRAQHERMVHVVDDEGFVVVRSEDEHLRLEKIKVEIGTGALGLGRMECLWWSTESPEWYRDKADQSTREGILFVECESINNPPADWLARPDAPAVWRLYGMIMPKPAKP